MYILSRVFDGTDLLGRMNEKPSKECHSCSIAFFIFHLIDFFLYSSHNRANSLFKSKYKLSFKSPFTISDNDLIQKQFQLEKLNLSPPNPIETYQHCPFSYQLAQKKNLNMVLRCLSENLASFSLKPKSNLFIPVLLVHSNREQ